MDKMLGEALKWKEYPNCQTMYEHILINHEGNTRHGHHEKNNLQEITLHVHQVAKITRTDNNSYIANGDKIW